MCDSSAARKFIKYIDDLFAAEDALLADVQHAKRKLFNDCDNRTPKRQRQENSVDENQVEPPLDKPVELKILNYNTTDKISELESQTLISKESILTLSHVDDISDVDLKTCNYDSSTEFDEKKSIVKESILTMSHEDDLEPYKELNERNERSLLLEIFGDLSSMEETWWELDSLESINYETVCHSEEEEISAIKNGTIIGFTDSCWDDESMKTLPLVKTPSSEIYLPGRCPLAPPMASSTPIKQIK